MASNQGRRQSSTTRKTSSRSTAGKNKSGSNSRNRSNSTRRNATRRKTNTVPMEAAIRNEIILIASLAVAVILFLCNFGIVGKVGNIVSDFLFGLLGLTAYIAPVILFLAIAFGMSNMGNRIATRKLIAGGILYLLISMICELFTANLATTESYQIKEIYIRCSENHNGGGIIAGSLTYASVSWHGRNGNCYLCAHSYLFCSAYGQVLY